MGFLKHILPNWLRSRLANVILFLKYGGRRYECPFCKGRFRKFLPNGLSLPALTRHSVVGGGFRLNAICPRCYSVDRERLIYLYLKNKSNLFSERISLLHIAPESSLQKILASLPNIDYLSADLSSPLADLKMDITNITRDDGSFDVIICNHVLEHVSDDRQAMAELFRVLKPNGWAIIQVPISLTLEETYENSSIVTPEEREYAFGQRDHVRLYGSDYKSRLESAGFSVDLYSFAADFGRAAVRKYALMEEENIYICRKTSQGKYQPR